MIHDGFAPTDRLWPYHQKSLTQQTAVHRFLQELSMTCLAIEALLCWTEVADAEAAIQGKLTAGYPKMMGLGKGGLWLKYGRFLMVLISMLDFWGVYKFWVSYWWFCVHIGEVWNWKCDYYWIWWYGWCIFKLLSVITRRNIEHLLLLTELIFVHQICQNKRTDPSFWFQPHEKSECHETIKKPVSGDHGFHPLTWYLGFSTLAAQTCQDTCSSTGVATEFRVSWLHTDLIFWTIFGHQQMLGKVGFR